MTSLREEITAIIDGMYKEYTTERISEEILSKIEKRIDEIQNIKNLKPAENSDDVFYNAGIWDGIERVKEILK